jgi:hypothetical protein
MQMRLQDYVANLTESATATLFRNAYAIPPEKLTWTQCEQTRSALDQLQECSQTALVFSKILRGESVEMSPRNFIKAKREREGWTTIEMCEKHAVTHTLEQLLLGGVKLPLVRFSLLSTGMLFGIRGKLHTCREFGAIKQCIKGFLGSK